MARMHVLWGLAAQLCHTAGRLLSYWPLIVVLAFFGSPEGPHVRWTNGNYSACIYVGSRGFVRARGALVAPPYCPPLLWLDTRGIRP